MVPLSRLEPLARPVRGQWIPALLVTGVPCVACVSTPNPPPSPAPAAEAGPTGARTEAASHAGGLSLLFENDLFLGDDSRFTAGVGLAWTSAELSSYAEGNFHRRLGDALSFLPRVGNEGYDGFLQFKLGMEMYTPRDILSADPPPGDHPYAGVLALDSSIFARGECSQHQYTLRLGLVGPSSGAEQAQRWIHKVTGSTIPAGWDTQLSDEFLLNANYQYNRCLYRAALSRTLAGDFSLNGGGGLGNYYIGGNVGLNLRLGHLLPDTYTQTPMLGGLEPMVGLAPSEKVYGYAFLGTQSFWVVRFLPMDGNTFQDSRSTERDDWYGTASAGFVIGYGHFALSYTYNGLSGLSGPNGIHENRQDDFGTFAFTYFFD